MNKAETTKNITFELPERFRNLVPKSHFDSDPQMKDGKISLELEAGSFDIITPSK